MTLSVETLLIVSLMMAVFAAVSTVGSSLFLGAGFERLRAGFENIKKQTAFFSDAIHKLDGRVEAVEKQSGYFFETLHHLEQGTAPPPAYSDAAPAEEIVPAEAEAPSFIIAARDEATNTGAGTLLSAGGFVQPQPVDVPAAPPAAARAPALTREFADKAGRAVPQAPQVMTYH